MDLDLTRGALARTVALGIAVATLECALARPLDPSSAGWMGLVVSALGLGAAVSLSRVAPLGGVAVLLLVELAGLVVSVPLRADELAVAIVAYNCARRGTRTTLWVSGLVVPIAYVVSGAFLANSGTAAAQRIDRAGLTGDPVALLLLLVTMASPLALPWMLGLTLRWRERAERGRHALVVAHAEAEAREQQARLAREVHDVVGHSLAVILRQADSVRFLPVTTPTQVLDVVDHISESARESLTEVRRVLSPGSMPPAPTDLDELIARIPPLVATVDDTVLGSPRPLPPDTAQVAHRVLQEMLTNAMKYGDARQIEVLRDWRDGLVLRVSNPSARPFEASSAGTGLDGMRQRLHGIGGTLDVRHESTSFTVEARIPLRGAEAAR